MTVELPISAVLCADWGKDPSKRAVYVADVAMRCVYRLASEEWSFAAVLVEARGLADKGPVLATFDVPFGLPASYLAAWRRATTFLDFLPQACALPDFFSVTSVATDWSVNRPFFSVPSGDGGLRSYETAAAEKGVGLYRAIDRRTGAKSLFVKSGIPGTVGHATSALWRELGPQLTMQRAFRVWPLEGDLDKLLGSAPIVIGEIYPRAAYATALLDVPVDARSRLALAKTERAIRMDAIQALEQAEWIWRLRVVLNDLAHARENEDDFDACLTAAALLRCVLDGLPLYAPLDSPKVEGGILGTGSVNLNLRERTFRGSQCAEPRPVSRTPTTGTSTSRTIAPSAVGVQQILACLSATKTRATYGAVAEVIGGLARGVGQRLGPRRPEASWVVSGATGLPSGYLPHEIDSGLFGAPIIKSGEELRALLGRWRANESAP